MAGIGILPVPALAQQAWDPDGSAGVQGGDGTWDAATANWTSDGGTTNQAWSPGGSGAFGETGSTVSVSGTQAFDSLTFSTDGYVLTGGALAIDGAPSSIGVTNSGESVVIGSVIQDGTGNSLNKTGAGLLTLSGANSYTGTTTVSAGILSVTGSLASTTLNVDTGGSLRVDGAAISDSAAVTVDAGGTLDLTGSETIGSLAGSGTVTLDANTLTTGGNNATTSFSGGISGVGGLTKTGGGTLTLSGANGYTGTTTVSDGTLNVSGSLTSNTVNVGSVGTLRVQGASISDAAAVTVDGTMDLTNSETIGSLAGGGNVTLNAYTLTAGGNNASTTFSNVISGTGGLTKTGGGTLLLSGGSTYTGTTTVSAGTLEVTGSLASDTLNVSSGGTLRVFTPSISNMAEITVSAGGTLDLTGSGGAIGSLAGDGSVTLNANTLTTGGNNATTSFSGGISGTGGLTKTGTGMLTLSGLNTYTGATSLGAGTLRLGASERIADGSDLTLSGGIFDLQGFDETVASLLATGGTIDLDDGTIGDSLVVNGSFSLQSGATLSINVDHLNQSDTVSVNGTVTLGGALSVAALPPDTAYSGASPVLQYTVIQNDAADAVSGTFSGVTTNFAFLAPTVDYAAGDGNDVILMLQNLSAIPDFAPFATTPNQSAVALSLADFDYSGGDGPVVLNAFNTLLNSQVPGVLNQVGGSALLAPSYLGGTGFGSFLQVITGRAGRGGLPSQSDGLIGNAFAEAGSADGRRIERAFGFADAAAARDQPVVAYWAAGHGDYYRVGSDGTAPGMKTAGGGIVFGAERAIEGAGLLGIAVGYSRHGFSTSGVGGTSTADTFSAGLYSRVGATDPTAGGFGLTAAAGLALHQYDTSRTISFGGLSRTASADYDGFSFGGEAIARYGLPVAADGWVAAPFAGLGYRHTRNDSFSESGAGSLDLSSSGSSYKHLTTTLGLEVAGHYRGDNAIVVPKASVSWRHEFLDTGTSSSFWLAGSPTQFTMVSAQEGRDKAVAAASLDFEFATDNAIKLAADVALSKSTTQFGAYAAFSSAF